MRSIRRYSIAAALILSVSVASSTRAPAQGWSGGGGSDQECIRRVRHWENALMQTLAEGGQHSWSAAQTYRSELERARAFCCRTSRRWSWCDSRGGVRPDDRRLDPNDPERDRYYNDPYLEHPYSWYRDRRDRQQRERRQQRDQQRWEPQDQQRWQGPNQQRDSHQDGQHWDGQ